MEMTKFVHERNLILNAFVTLAALFGIQAAAYMRFYSKITGLAEHIWPIIILINTGAVATTLSLYHFKLLNIHHSFSRMSSMTFAMTSGMMAGFIAGAVTGAMNGMFYGCLGGMAVGMAIGCIPGKFCGIETAMEGLKAGIMTGAMGTMLSVMMIYDHLIPFLFIFISTCVVLLTGASYLMYSEAGNIRKAGVSDMIAFFVTAVFAALLLSLFAFYGPKSGLYLGSGGQPA
jgi:hypothetical protein